MATLTPDEARAFYDRFGSKQDRQAFYEAKALGALVANAAFESAKSVFEFGCGTGRFALDLLEHRLPQDAVYRGSDLSTTMVGLAASRLARFAPRASVFLAAPEPVIPLEDRSADRIVSTYVLDLLPAPAARRFFSEARRVLRPQGLLCLVGITHGTTPWSFAVMKLWEQLFAWNPSWVGGCRPTRLVEQLPSGEWAVRFRSVIVSWGIASEALVAAPCGAR